MNGFETRYRQELFDGSFFKKSCPICGKELTFLHPLLYVDRPHHFLLLIKSKQDQNEQDHTTYLEDTSKRKRYISNVEEVGEKIRILEDELDDRVIELIKAKLYLHYKKRYVNLQSIHYHDVDKKSRTIWFDLDKEEAEIVAIEEQTYHAMLSKLDEESQNFVEIDRKWALKQLGIVQE